MELFIFILEIIGTIAFSASGSMTAIEKDMDILGISILGMTTAVGGGVIRDLVLGIHPPNAFQNPVYSIVSIVFSLIIVVIINKFGNLTDNKIAKQLYAKIVNIFDSVGLGIFTVVGVSVAFNNYSNNNLFMLVFVGVVTGVGGGVLRDIMSGNMPYIFKKHVYASASIIGAVLCSILWPILGRNLGMLIGAIVVIVVRLLAAHYKWNLPRVKRAKSDMANDI